MLVRQVERRRAKSQKQSGRAATNRVVLPTEWKYTISHKPKKPDFAKNGRPSAIPPPTKKAPANGRLPGLSHWFSTHFARRGFAGHRERERFRLVAAATVATT